MPSTDPKPFRELPMRARRHLTALALAGAVLPYSPMAGAQTPQNEIVVVGDRQRAEVVAGRLSRRISHTVDNQIARFDHRVCLSVLGLPDRFAAIIKAQFASDAAASGLVPGGEGCRPNLTVLFAKDAAAIVEHLPGAPANDRKRELKGGGPSYLLSATTIKSRDGDVAGRAGTPLTGSSDRDLQFLQVRTASIIQSATRQDITGLLLVVERDAILGRSLRQLAGYIAMRGLAQASDRQVSAGDDTILTLLKAPDASAPAGLTRFDRAYLKALYRGTGTDTGPITGSRILYEIGRQAEAPEPGG